MHTFTIDTYNNIARLAAHERPTRESEKFTSEKELANLPMAGQTLSRDMEWDFGRSARCQVYRQKNGGS